MAAENGRYQKWQFHLHSRKTYLKLEGPLSRVTALLAPVLEFNIICLLLIERALKMFNLIDIFDTKKLESDQILSGPGV